MTDFSTLRYIGELESQNRRMADEIKRMEAAIKKAYAQAFIAEYSDTPHKDACMALSDAFMPLGFYLEFGEEDSDITAHRR